MLYRVKDLEKLKIDAKDGNLGYIDDFYFDDVSWVTRYVVVDTGKWLTGRKVLISPFSIEKPKFQNKSIPVSLTKKQIEESPGIHVDEPVSRQHEQMLTKYYGWPAYWTVDPTAQAILAQRTAEIEKLSTKDNLEKDGDPHLRSIREIRNYNVEAIDGDVGHVDSFIIDDSNWNIKYLVIDTRKWMHWLPGGKFAIISPDWIKKIDWEESKVSIEYDKETLENSPLYDPTLIIDEEFENRLYDCYRLFVEKKYEHIA